MLTLEIQIATHGKDGLRSILQREYPVVENVIYRVGWQQGTPLNVDKERFIVKCNQATSLTLNRNILLEIVTGDIILFSDNDISYTIAQIQSVIDAFNQNQEADFICFKLENRDKIYPSQPIKIDRLPKKYFPSSCEIAIRKRVLLDNYVRFDTRFGLGSKFICGEETLLISDLIKQGFKGLYLPIVIGRHESDFSTGTNPRLTNRVNEAKGAVTTVLSPLTAPIRLIARSIKNRNFGEFIYGLKGYFKVVFNV